MLYALVALIPGNDSQIHFHMLGTHSLHHGSGINNNDASWKVLVGSGLWGSVVGADAAGQTLEILGSEAESITPHSGAHGLARF